MKIVASPVERKKTKRQIRRSMNIIDASVSEKETNQIMAVCRHFSFIELENLNCLYLGTVDNVKTECLARNFRELIVFDNDKSNLRVTSRLSDQGNIRYICGEDGNLSINDLTIDVVVCDRFYSWVDNPAELMFEIYRVMKYEGFCYFGAYNKLSLVERNYSVPFLAWVPGWMGEVLMKLSGCKGKYNHKLLALPKLRKLIDNFWRHDYVGLIRYNPLAFQAQDTVGSKKLKSKKSGKMLKYIYPFLPLWVWVLTKKK